MKKESVLITPVQRFAAFLKAESAGGIVMLLATCAALIIANSSFAAHYDAFIHGPLALGIGAHTVSAPLHVWVNDAGMVLFFFIIGMELKRELTEGVLVDKRQVLLPMIAALGGMIVPACIFLMLNKGIAEHQVGWAIPTATDIAFALAIMLVAAKNVPPALKIFLLAIAIFDDLGAILIIAIFYSHGIAWLPLVTAALGVLLLGILHHKRVACIWPYLLLGVAICIGLHYGGVHATIGGVITGLCIPMRAGEGEENSPIDRTIHLLHPWVSFGLLPLFAFTVAGIVIEVNDLLSSLMTPLSLGIIFGLFLGKQIGIAGASWIAIKMKLAALPEATNWRQLHAISVIAGIGFTMSLFISNLAFHDGALLAHAKLAVMAASVLSALIGWGLLRSSIRG